jgi:hypothetical protein
LEFSTANLVALQQLARNLVDWGRDTDTTKPQQAEGRRGRGSILCLCGGIVDFIKEARQLVDRVVKCATKIAVKVYYRSGLPLVEMEALLALRARRE